MNAKWKISIVLTFLGLHFSMAQSLKSDSLFIPGSVKQYQFNLEKPAQQIDNLQYENSGEPIRGKLSIDRTKVLMDNYKKGERVKFSVIYDDGTRGEISKSPCYIDPVRYEL